MLFADLVTAHIALRRPDENLQVLPHRLVFFTRQPTFQRLRRLFRRLCGTLDDSRLEIKNLLVPPLDAELTGAFRVEPRDYLQQHLRVLITARDPRGLRRSSRPVDLRLVAGNERFDNGPLLKGPPSDKTATGTR